MLVRPVWGIGIAISIHALLAESDDSMMRKLEDMIHFYPRSPCGERPLQYSQTCGAVRISIHALLAESDDALSVRVWIVLPFLSTLSLRRATLRPVSAFLAVQISIHALLAESDGLPKNRKSAL